MDNKFLDAMSKVKNNHSKKNDIWKSSPFKWIKECSSRKIGAIGEQILSNFLENYGIDVKRSPDSSCDRIINGKRVEIKTSTLWSSGLYKFQQIRDQDYDYIILFGISPNEIHFWLIDKKTIIKMWKTDGIISGQHTGKAASETAWITLTPDNTDNNFKMFGNSVEMFLNNIKKMGG